MREILFAFAIVSVFVAHGQVIGVVIDTVTVHQGMTGGVDLTGFTTYRVYAMCQHSDDALLAVSGDNESPLSIQTDGTFFQSEFGGLSGSDQNPNLYQFFPSAEYDTFITIGLTEAAGSGEGNINTVEEEAQLWESIFESGASLVCNGIHGGGWFVFPSNTNSTPDSNNRVLLAQITANGGLNIQLNILSLVHGSNWNAVNSYVQSSVQPDVSFGCMDSSASNFSPEANADGFNCIPSNCELEIELSSIEQATSNNYNSLEIAITNSVQFDYSSSSLPFPCATNYVPLIPSATASEALSSDFDHDGDIDIMDFLLFLPFYGSIANSEFDTSGDGLVMAQDLLNLIMSFEETNNVDSVTLQFSGIQPGLHTIQAIDDIGCTAELTFEIEESELPYDLNGDFIINVLDVLEFLTDYGCTGLECSYDLNSDGVTGVTDLLLLLESSIWCSD